MIEEILILMILILVMAMVKLYMCPEILFIVDNELSNPYVIEIVHKIIPDANLLEGNGMVRKICRSNNYILYLDKMNTNVTKYVLEFNPVKIIYIIHTNSCDGYHVVENLTWSHKNYSVETDLGYYVGRKLSFGNRKAISTGFISDRMMELYLSLRNTGIPFCFIDVGYGC